MAENILTEPMQQNDEMTALPARTVTLPAGTWMKIADQQAQRASLLVLRSNFNDAVFVSPVNYGTVGLVTAVTDPYPINIHMAAFPLRIAGVWWALSSGGQDVQVLETIRNSG